MSTNAASSSSTPTVTPQGELDIEKILVREASAFQREVEVERILKAFKLKYAFRIYC
jgi:DnaJ family protein C protein 8